MNNTKGKADGGNEVRYYYWKLGRIYFKTIGQIVYTYHTKDRKYSTNGFKNTAEFVANFGERITVVSPKKMKLMGFPL